MQQTDLILKAWLQRAIAAGGPYDPAALFLGVAVAVTDNGVNTVQADVTEATGDMATRQAIAAWGAPHKLNDGRWCVDAAPKTFLPADSTEAQILSHWFLNTAAAAGTLKAFKPFAPPVNLPDENYSVSITVRLTVDPDGRFDQSVITNGE